MSGRSVGLRGPVGRGRAGGNALVHSAVFLAAVVVAARSAGAQTCSTTRVSVASSGAEADAATGLTTMTGDGRYIAFNSGARNLVHDLN